MQPQPRTHRVPVLTASGNWEERAAQIERIQERLNRLHRLSEHITTEVAAMVKEVQKLNDPAPPFSAPPATKEPVHH